MERRYEPRYPLLLNALLYHPRGFVYPCHLENASLGGLRVKGDCPTVAKGQCIKVVIDVSSHNSMPLTTKGLVVHKENAEIGILCDEEVPVHALRSEGQYLPRVHRQTEKE